MDRLSLIGRNKCVAVFYSGGDTVGVVSDIVVRGFIGTESGRLSFAGPVGFSESCKEHMTLIILPIVDAIVDALKVEKCNFEISVTSPGATALAGIRSEISGFSADLPILVALLSACLGMPIKQSVIGTGHIASLDGDLVCVRGIAAKIKAAISIPGISAFVLPDLERDNSAKLLTPIEHEFAKESVLKHKGEISIHTAESLLKALKLYFTSEAIVYGALRTGFFKTETPEVKQHGHIGKIIEFLIRDNNTRFWDTLEDTLLHKDLGKARELLLAYIEFHIRNQVYPNQFGKKLLHLVISLPPLIRKIENLFPLLPMEFFICLTQHAEKKDHDDIRKLYRVSFDEGLKVNENYDGNTEQSSTIENDQEGELGWILNELRMENIAEKIGLPLDRARARYIMDTVTVKNGREFNDAVTSFYTHMCRHSGLLAESAPESVFSAEAIELVKRAFSQKGEYSAALSEGIYAVNGGMRKVFDTMTDHLKAERMAKYITKIFKDFIDPTCWEEKVKLMEAFLNRIKPDLPDNLENLPAKQLAHHWESIIKRYAESMHGITDLLKKL